MTHRHQEPRSHLSVRDALYESWTQVTRRPARSIMTGLGVALSAATFVTVISLSATIRFQVSDEFDARQATQVEVRTRDVGVPREQGDFPPDAAVLRRIAGLTGVEAVAVVRESRGDHRVAASRVVDPRGSAVNAQVVGVTAASFVAIEAVLVGPGWGPWHDDTAQRVVVLPRRMADAMGFGDADIGARVFVSDIGFTLVGIIDGADRLPIAMNAILMPISATLPFEADTDRDRMLIITAPGAARQVAAVLSVALDPTDPGRWIAYAPADDQRLRRSVDAQLESLSLALGAAILVLGVVSIGNSTLASVMQRIPDLGLRRAIGARPRHIAAHIALEAVVIGALGGVIGGALGTTAILLVTALQGWVPVMPPTMLVYVVIGGAVAGAVAGAYPARVASRLEPTEALRRE